MVDKILYVNANHVVIFYSDKDVFHIRTSNGTALQELMAIFKEYNYIRKVA